MITAGVRKKSGSGQAMILCSVEDVMTNAGMFTERWLAAYEDKRRYSWAIQLKKTGEVIGRFLECNQMIK